MNAVDLRLYGIVDPGRTGGRDPVPLAAAAVAGGCTLIQYRDKEADTRTFVARARSLKAALAGTRVPLLVNDRVDVALAAQADGVHVGQDDTPYAEARRIVGPDRQVGVTCKASRHLAMEAAEAGADYVAFGAFFQSGTKTVTTPAELDILEWWSGLMQVPCVAIGGITAENCRPVIAAGADFLAVAGGVWNHKDGPEAAVRAFNEIFSAHR